MRETEFWRRMTRHLGAGYARVWADQTVLTELDNRTASEALAAGVPFKTVWRAVWAFLELPDRER
ncbi:MAG: DUF3046 domain-containing protein [Propionibacteriaceae bacterium]|uniref:DUF3046 domain-containing protein n=1 Tax=Propionibacterium ruminifibrarum TaxID=1962131 RepID=A0A375HYW6_9ACTN|nr:DUF3046 domain-containing protein [Propionibacterium ruminifibrarum]MBE6477051.1 DUF3046 domain-containing protein [Propionibacteriaceae bacterium]SPF67671.1 Protein of unknown function (DUF3046) [Propionibacterium ruminifibrarum]